MYTYIYIYIHTYVIPNKQLNITLFYLHNYVHTYVNFLATYTCIIFKAIFVQCYLFVSMPTSFVALILVKKLLTGYHRNVSQYKDFI